MATTQNSPTKRIRQLFDELDRTGSGYIDTGELDHFLQLTGVTDASERAAQVNTNPQDDHILSQTHAPWNPTLILMSLAAARTHRTNGSRWRRPHFFR